MDELLRSLAPPARAPDRAFVLQVSARVALLRQAHQRRRSEARRLIGHGLALAAAAGALVWLGQAPGPLRLAAESPVLAFAMAGAMLSALVLLIGVRSPGALGRLGT